MFTASHFPRETQRNIEITTCPRSARLKDICAIQPGYAAHQRLVPTARGEGAPLIKLQDLTPKGLADPNLMTRCVWPDRLSDRYLVQAGDVIFRPRGDRNTAAILDARFREPAVVLIPLFILRPKRHTVLPAFLAWAINQPPAQRHFDRVARGTNMRMVLRPGLENLEVDLPAMEDQRRIVAIDALAQRERALTVRAAEMREQLITRTLGSLASGTHRPGRRLERPPL